MKRADFSVGFRRSGGLGDARGGTLGLMLWDLHFFLGCVPCVFERGEEEIGDWEKIRKVGGLGSIIMAFVKRFYRRSYAAFGYSLYILKKSCIQLSLCYCSLLS